MKQALAIVAFVMLAPQGLAQSVPEPTDYRMEEYRSPVPATLLGATVIGPEEAHAFWTAGTAAFIDVMPRPPKPANLPEGTIWRDKPRNTIPGAIWVPNVGYGAIADVTATYFREALELGTGGDPDYPVVVFCLQDCWMSWNAARRALAWGYTSVYWLPEGTDGWDALDYPLERATPKDGQPQTQ